MKYFLFIILFTWHQAKSQEHPDVLAEWTKIKTAFSGKSAEAKRIATLALDSQAADKDVLNKVMAYANRMAFGSKEDAALDSTGFYRLGQSGDSLEVYMEILMKQLEGDKAFLFSKAFPVFRSHYRVASTVLAIAKHDFNLIARKHKSRFHFADKTEAPAIDFD